MKKLLVIFLLFPLLSTAQVGEAGIFLGGSYYLGDLNPSKQFYRTKFAPGILYRQNTANDRWVFRFHLNYGRVEAYDSESNLSSHQQRNLDFKSSIIEFGPVVELNFLPYQPGTKTNMGNRNRKNGTPYIFAGINYFRMNPQGTYNGDWLELQAIGTEGQTPGGDKKLYSLNQISIPVGLGLKFNLSERFAMSFEYGIRKTFTDYLDDVSTTYADPSEMTEIAVAMANKSTGDVPVVTGAQRGNPSIKDWYSFSGVMLTYRVRRATSCPRRH